jgi:murein DD-endopeptidase MepM/ murein hydrolase activator NlpD
VERVAWIIRPPVLVVSRGNRGMGTTFVPPVSGRISSDFGPRAQPVAGASTDHKGIDYGVAVGTPVSASAAGRVIFAGVQSGFGNTVQIDHGGGLVTTYGHLSSINVVPGQQVSGGQLVGLSGATGTVSGPNLHFGLAVNGVLVDPESYLVQASLPAVLQTAAPAPAAVDAMAPDASSMDPLAIGLLVAMGVAALAAVV